MAKVTATQLKKHLQARSQEDLINEIVFLFSKFDAVKNYYQFQLVGEPDEEIVGRYKSAIRREFSTGRTPGPARLSSARKIVNDYKKIAPSEASLIDLMLVYVEAGVNFTAAFGDIDEPFYNSMESMYQRALELIAKGQLQEDFEVRCRKIVTATQSMGWGFYDNLNAMYGTFFTLEQNKHERGPGKTNE
jgi:hypothetical protein